MDQVPDKPKSRRALFMWLFVSQLIALALVYPMLYMAGYLLSLLMNTSLADPFAFLLITSPLPGIPLLLAIGAWFAYARHQDRLAAVLSGLAFGVPVGLLLLMSAGLAWRTVLF